jgi:hypothetical protein
MQKCHSPIPPPLLSTLTSLVLAALLGREFRDDSIRTTESEGRMLTVIRGWAESGASLKPRAEINAPDSYHYSPAVFNNSSPLRMAAIFPVGQVCQPTNQGCTHEWLVAWLVHSRCSHLEHGASVKRFISLQFLNLRHSVGLLGLVISPSQGRYLTQIQNKHRHPCLEWDSKPRSQRLNGRRQFMP